MVFSSIPTYQIDASNWQQQQNHQIIGSSSTNSSLPPPPPPQSFPPPVLSQPHGGVGAGSIRPGSMSERARMANIPVPDMALKCPRCDSTNTKFCYYNNYNLSQPRHFCKTCRRYWTRGGALRSVPVGGGCRRNKRSKSTTSKTPTTTDRQITSNSATSGSANILGLTQPQFPPLRFMSPLNQLTNHNFTSDMNYSGISGPMVGTNDMNFNLLGQNSGGVASFLSGGGSSSVSEPWRLQQFPFLDGNYQFQGGESGFEGHHHQVLRPPKFSSSMVTTQMVTEKKMEEKTELNLSRQFLGLQGNDDQWNHNLSSNNANAAWTELSSFGSSSTNNL